MNFDKTREKFIDSHSKSKYDIENRVSIGNLEIINGKKNFGSFSKQIDCVIKSHNGNNNRTNQ